MHSRRLAWLVLLGAMGLTSTGCCWSSEKGLKTHFGSWLVEGLIDAALDDAFDREDPKPGQPNKIERQVLERRGLAVDSPEAKQMISERELRDWQTETDRHREKCDRDGDGFSIHAY